MKRKLISKKPFEFSARVTLQLGRESISSSTAAISELVKNSYDADAANVNVNFHLKEHSTSSLVITDDGWGMSSEDLLSDWLRVGTEKKKSLELSKSGRRVLTGAKGLGRLGIDRLCKRLVLYTKTKDSPTATLLTINWREYEKEDRNISDVEHEVYEVELPIIDKYGKVFLSDEDHGTRLLLVGLKDRWDKKFLNDLENELRLLVSPFRSNNDFSIRVSTFSENENTTEKLGSEDLLDFSSWTVSASVSSQSQVSIELKDNKRNEIHKLDYYWEEWIKDSKIKHNFGPVRFSFYYIPQDNAKLNSVNFKRTDFQQFMRLNRGVRIYRDNFRVRPYGEPTGRGDWLDLGYRKASSPGGIAQGGWRIAPNQILGAVEISRRTNSPLNDQANREGILQNDAFLSLRTFVLKVIDEFETKAHKVAASHKAQSDSEQLKSLHLESQKHLNEASTSLHSSISTLYEDTISKDKKKILKKQIDEFEKAQKRQRKTEREYYESLKREKELLEDQKNTLSNLASLGILTVCFGHEIRQHTSQALTDSLEIWDVMNDAIQTPLLPVDHDECLRISESIQRNISYIEKFSSLALSNIKPDKRKRKRVNIPKVFRYVFDLMSSSFNAMDIDYNVLISTGSEANYNALAFEIDWESIAINLITNSMWALEKIDSSKRFIEVEFSDETDNTILISFRDSGVGLEAGSEESIFLPMKSSKRDRAGNVTGTGMGLAIVKSHIENHSSGKLTATASSSLGGAEFNFRIPRAK